MQPDEIELFSAKRRKKARPAGERRVEPAYRHQGGEEGANAGERVVSVADDTDREVDQGLADSFEALGVGSTCAPYWRVWALSTRPRCREGVFRQS